MRHAISFSEREPITVRRDRLQRIVIIAINLKNEKLAYNSSRELFSMAIDALDLTDGVVHCRCFHKAETETYERINR